MKKIRLFLTGLLLVMTSAVFAQNITVSGTVTDAKTGEVVPGAAVLLKGDNTRYSMTDDLGNYSLSVPQNGVLVVSFMGYKTVEVPVNGRTTVNVALEMDTEMLDDVVVVGYGSAKDVSSLTGSVSMVNKKVLANRPAANAGDALQGQVAGLQIFSSTGEPMSNVSMRMRGVNSINAGSTPLIILDGAPVSVDIFNTLNSNDIENITVMKDASSTAIYGSRAANGVIYITTKKGKRGEQASVSVRGQYGISSNINHRMDLMNTNQWIAFNEKVNPGFKLKEAMKLAQQFGISTDWRKYFFNDAAPVWSVDLSITGATDNTDYYMSLGVFDQTGTLPYSSVTRYNLRSNINSKINNWLKVGVNLGLAYQDYTTAGFSTTGNSWYNPTSASNWMLPYISPYEYTPHYSPEDGSAEYLEWGGERKFFSEVGMWNTYYLQELQPSNSTNLRLNGSTYLELTPFKGFTLRAQQNVDGTDYRFKYKAIPEGPFEGSGDAREDFSRYYTFTFTNTAEYNHKFAGEHNFTALIGQEAMIYNAESFGVRVSGITDKRQNNLSDGVAPFSSPSWSLSETVSNSYFVRLSYDYGNRYYVDASWRIDGSSLFGANKRYANFYSVGAMWSIKNEDFLSSTSWINDLRLKASFGTTGNSSISNYMSYGTIGSYGSDYDGVVGWGIANCPNPDLTWETVETLNIGISSRFWDFLNLDVEFYNKNTRDMLMAIPYSYTTGHSSGWGNIGTMLNRGVDVEVGFDIINNSNMYFNIKTNFNYNHNEITSLFNGRDEFVVPNTGIIYRVGYPYGEFFYVRDAGVDPRDGMQMWYDTEGNRTKTYSEDNAVMTGKQRYAPWAGGLQLNFTWKGLYVGADFSWVAGKWTMNNDRYFLINPQFTTTESNGAAELLNIWTEYGQKTNVPSINSERHFDTSLLEDASFFRMKNLQIAYTFPEKWMKKTGFIRSFRIYAIGRNLLTATKYTGYDPEVDSNLQLGVYPNSKQYTFGIELTF